MPRLNPPIYPQDMLEMPLPPSWVSDTLHIEHHRSSDSTIVTAAVHADNSTEQLLLSPEYQPGESTIAPSTTAICGSSSSDASAWSFGLKLVDSLEVTRIRDVRRRTSSEAAKGKCRLGLLAKLKRLGSLKRTKEGGEPGEGSVERTEGGQWVSRARKLSLRKKVQVWFAAAS